jgi:hypothetical protein
MRIGVSRRRRDRGLRRGRDRRNGGRLIACARRLRNALTLGQTQEAGDDRDRKSECNDDAHDHHDAGLAIPFWPVRLNANNGLGGAAAGARRSQRGNSSGINSFYG